MKGPILTKTVFLSLFLILSVLTINSFAQDKEKSELKKKLADLKGKVEKITVKVDGKDVVFEGKDAENLAKKMRTSGSGVFSYSVGGGSGKGAGVGRGMTYSITSDKAYKIKDDNDNEEAVYLNLADNENEKEKKLVDIEKIDGKTTVTITTTDKEGKEVKKILEGDDAEKYLNDNDEVITLRTSGMKMRHSTTPVRIKLMKGKPSKTIFIEKEDDDDDDNAVIIEKDNKVKKDVVIKKKKLDTVKEEKEK